MLWLRGKTPWSFSQLGEVKSLCFCFPPLVTQKVSIVITPTISLMADQVRGLQKKGIQAAHLGGEVKNADILPRLRAGEYQVLFVTPEKFLMTNGMPYQCSLDLSSVGKLLQSMRPIYLQTGVPPGKNAHAYMSHASVYSTYMWIILCVSFQFPGNSSCIFNNSQGCSLVFR